MKGVATTALNSCAKHRAKRLGDAAISLDGYKGEIPSSNLLVECLPNSLIVEGPGRVNLAPKVRTSICFGDSHSAACDSVTGIGRLTGLLRANRKVSSLHEMADPSGL